MKIRENEINKIVKDNFNSKNVLLSLDGIVEGHISFIEAVCIYNSKNGILSVSDLLNNIKIDIVSQYSIIYEKENERLKIYLDNGQNIKLLVLKNKKLNKNS